MAAFLCFRLPEPSEESTRMAGLKLRRLWRRSDSAASPSPPSTAGGATARVASFNTAMFSVAPAVPSSWKSSTPEPTPKEERRPKSILKQRSFNKSKRRVSINLPENEISLLREKSRNSHVESGRSVLEVLREIGADILSLQNVKAEEEKGMSPLSDLAEGLGMSFVFAESWAPQFGNAILSRWPIKRWKVQKISPDSDFRSFISEIIQSSFTFSRDFTQERARGDGRSAENRRDHRPLHAPRSPQRELENEAVELHPALQRRSPYPHGGAQRPRRDRLFLREMDRYRQG